MKLRLIEQALTENSLDNPKAIADFIKDNCQIYITHHRDHLDDPLYRGIQGEKPVAFQTTIRADRKSSGTPVWANNIYNEAVQSLGLTANRNNSLFVTGDYRQAQGYGTLFVIYPIGDFDFTWSEHIGDYYEFLGNFVGTEKELKETLEVMLRGNDNLDSAVSSENEILVKAGSALYINSKLFEEVKEYL